MTLGERADPASPRVAVLVCCYNQKQYIADCLGSLRVQDYAALKTYFLDNNSSDGSADYVAVNHPECTLIRLGANLGFAAANNVGLARAYAEGAGVCLLLNTDTRCGPSMVSELIATYGKVAAGGTRVGLVQATVLLHDQPERVNTTGNALHYLGYGFCRDYLVPYQDYWEDRRIASASGAAMLVSREYFEKVGGLDEEFFVYNEDQNLSWRGLLQGYEHYVSARAVVYHKYTYRNHSFKMYHSEKNRLTMVMQNYAGRTLALLGPMLLLNEVMICGLAVREGWLWAKLRSYAYLMRTVRGIRLRRRAMQSTRKVADAEIFPQMEARLDFPAYSGWAVRKLISPLMAFYHHLVRGLV